MGAEAVRFMTKKNATKGIEFIKGGMGIIRNAEALPIDLNQTITWSDTESGAVVIMGLWHEISSLIGAAPALQLRSEYRVPDMSRGYVSSALDVNAEFDAMYGDDERTRGLAATMELPIIISAAAGAAWRKTDDVAEVVLDPRTEVVKTFGSRLAGVAGTAAPGARGVAGLVLGAIGAAKDSVGIGLTVKGVAGSPSERQKQFDRTQLTITIDITRTGTVSKNTESRALDRDQVLRHTVDLVVRLWKG